MRHLVFTVAFALVAGSAAAASIEPIVSGRANNHSITTITCASCPALADKTAETVFPAIELKPGTQKIELKSIDGEMKVVRTEAWLGGSPVVFVHKATQEEIQAGVETGNPDAMVAIDTTAKTAAVAGMAGATPEMSQQFDPTAFELRLD